MAQHSHLYMTAGKNIALTIQTFVSKVMSLLFNMLSRFGFPGGSKVKASACKAGDPGSIPGSGRSPGEGNGNPLSILAWRIPWMEETGRLQSMGLQRVRHD